MHIYAFGLVWGAICYMLYKATRTVAANRHHAAEAKRLGCEPAHIQKNSFLGIGRVRRALQALRDKTFPYMLRDFYKEQNGATTWSYQTFGKWAYFTVDPLVVKAVLATQFDHFGHGSTRRDAFLPFLGEGIFTVNGKRWEHSRATLRPQFARDQVSDLDLEERHVQNLLLHIPVDASGWTAPIDLQAPFYRLTLDSATEFLFGESVDSQLATLPRDRRPATFDGKTQRWSDFADVWDRSTAYVMMGISLENLGWMVNFIPHVRAAYKRIQEFADFYVERALINSEHRQGNTHGEPEQGQEKKRFVFLDAMIEQIQDPTVLRNELLNLLIAGRDTTAALLGFLFHVLAQNPACFYKLRATIIKDFGTFDSPKEITFASLKSCKYLQWCLNETLRVHHVVPINNRAALQDTTLPRGGGPDGTSPLYVRKGQEVWWASSVMHMRMDIWGTDAEEFKPERWDGKKTGWEYIPFNGGARTCIGQQFSLTEASYVTVRLLQRFDTIENLDKDNVTKYEMKLTCSIDEVNVRLHQAAKASV